MRRLFLGLLLFAFLSVAGIGLLLVGASLLTEYYIVTNTYPFLGCEPPSLTTEQAKDAVRLMAREVLGIESPQVGGASLERLSNERWPKFTGSVALLRDGGGTIYSVEGNGCGLEIQDPDYKLTVNVSLPGNKLFSVRRGSSYQRF